MALSLEEIIWRVDDIEQKKVPYRTRADKWMKMWQIKIFDKTPAQAMAEDSQESRHSA